MNFLKRNRTYIKDIGLSVYVEVMPLCAAVQDIFTKSIRLVVYLSLRLCIGICISMAVYQCLISIDNQLTNTY
jgi:hypothetical protein